LKIVEASLPVSWIALLPFHYVLLDRRPGYMNVFAELDGTFVR
jgi:hypothetical protein